MRNLMVNLWQLDMSFLSLQLQTVNIWDICKETYLCFLSIPSTESSDILYIYWHLLKVMTLSYHFLCWWPLTCICLFIQEAVRELYETTVGESEVSETVIQEIHPGNQNITDTQTGNSLIIIPIHYKGQDSVIL
jgi:hypothetical protein